MNLNRADSQELARKIAAREFGPDVEVLVCPPFAYLDAVGQETNGSEVKLGGQDVYHQGNGAFTGEISTTMLNDLGCAYVILGHSERRNVMGENDGLINEKVKSALSAGISPILCVGELLEQREAGQTMDVVQAQFEGSLAEITADQASQIVIAYEPVWAIGTGKTATPEQAQEVHADLRNLLASRYNREIADNVRILYGGSVKPTNAAELLSQSDIDGALVGGASLQADSFCDIIAASNSITSG